MAYGKPIPFLGLSFAAVLLVPAIPASGQYTTVAGSRVLNTGGVPVAVGSICFQPTNSQGQPLTVSLYPAGPVATTGVSGPLCSSVVNGAILSLQVPDPASTFPRNYVYSVTVSDASTGDAATYDMVKVAGPSFSWDNYSAAYTAPQGAFTPVLTRLERPKATAITRVICDAPGSTNCDVSQAPVSSSVPVSAPLQPVLSSAPGSVPPSSSSSASATTALVSSPGPPTSSVSGTVNALDFPGADIGARINAASASFAHGGEVDVPPTNGCYQYATPIVLAPMTRLKGLGSFTTCLRFTGSGTALTLPVRSELSGMMLDGGGSSATGLLLLGTDTNVDNVFITGFGLGVTFGNNSYVDSFYHVHLEKNTRNLYYPAKLTNSGENFSFVASSISGGGTFANCVQIGDPGVLTNGEFSFISTSFDACQVVNNESLVKFYGTHFEDNGIAANHPFVKTLSSALQAELGDVGTYMYGASVQLDEAPVGTGLFEVDRFGQLHIFGVFLGGASAIPLVQLGAAESESPTLELTDGANVWPESKLYSVFPGAVPVLNISTRAVSQHTSESTHVFADSSMAAPYGSNEASVVSGSFIGQYVWSGTSQSWAGSKLMIDRNNGFRVCNSGFFPFAGYAALGTEPSTCGTTLGANSVVTQSYKETLTTPASSSAACNAGQFTDDENYHYVCVAENTWKRVALSPF